MSPYDLHRLRIKTKVQTAILMRKYRVRLGRLGALESAIPEGELRALWGDR